MMGQKEVYMFLKNKKGNFFSAKQLALYLNCRPNNAAKSAMKLVRLKFINLKLKYGSDRFPRYGIYKD